MNKSTTMLFLIIFPVLAIAQMNPGVLQNDYERINRAINSIYGDEKYRVTDLINVDSAIGRNRVSQYSIENPFGTLNHCYLFTAEAKPQENDGYPRGFFGIFKDNQIIWHLDTLINSFDVATAGYVTVSDINRDGKVELVCYWEEGIRGGNRYIWIAGWDGQVGQLLNSFDSEGHSEIASFSDDLEIVDKDGDGIKEIQGRLQENLYSDSTVAVTYCWNGQLYSRCVPPQITALPKNKVIVTIRSKVSKYEDSFQFSYRLINSSESIQRIENFVLVRGTNNIFNVTGRDKWEFILSEKKPLLIWEDLDGENLMAQSDVDSSFSFTTNALPGIQLFFVQGNNGPISTKDIYDNSVKGKTIGPVDPSSQFIPINWIDTLITYKHQAIELDWILNKGITTSLDQKLENARQQLQKGNTKTARNILEAFVNEVEALNKQENQITSEAYALLKYNAEYLISKL
ncbi:MAG: hypothetical protein V1799_01015 [bacterium]